MKIVEYVEDQAAKKNLPLKTVLKQIIDEANENFEKQYRDNRKKKHDELTSKIETFDVHWGDSENKDD